LRLGRWFGTGQDIAMNLQKNYELWRAEQEIGEALQKSRRIMAVPRQAKICRFLRAAVQRARGPGPAGRQAALFVF